MASIRARMAARPWWASSYSPDLVQLVVVKLVEQGQDLADRQEVVVGDGQSAVSTYSGSASAGSGIGFGLGRRFGFAHRGCAPLLPGSSAGASSPASKASDAEQDGDPGPAGLLVVADVLQLVVVRARRAAG